MTEDSGSKVRKIVRLGLYIVVVLLSLYLINSVSKIISADKKIERVQERLEETKSENQAIHEDLDRVTSDFFVEKQARDKLGLAKEGEIVIVLPEDEELKKLVAEEVKEENDPFPEPNWKKWLKLFF